MHLLRQRKSLKRLEIVVRTWLLETTSRNPESQMRNGTIEALRKVQGCQEVKVRLDCPGRPRSDKSYSTRQEWIDFARGLKEDLCYARRESSRRRRAPRWTGISGWIVMHFAGYGPGFYRHHYNIHLVSKCA